MSIAKIKSGSGSAAYFIFGWPQSFPDIYGFPKGSYGIFCSKKAVIIDSGHFTLTSYGIAKDCIASSAPYIAFPDPGMNGLLYISPSKLNIAGYDDFTGTRLATQRDINALLQIVAGKIAGML